jgi:hypothetical protein
LHKNNTKVQAVYSPFLLFIVVVIVLLFVKFAWCISDSNGQAWKTVNNIRSFRDTESFIADRILQSNIWRKNQWGVVLFLDLDIPLLIFRFYW